MITLIDSQYFPCLEYFSLLKSRSGISIETKERFEKQSYRNRCYIMSSNSIQLLTVPINNAGKKFTWLHCFWNGSLARDLKVEINQMCDHLYANLFHIPIHQCMCEKHLDLALEELSCFCLNHKTAPL